MITPVSRSSIAIDCWAACKSQPISRISASFNPSAASVDAAQSTRIDSSRRRYDINVHAGELDMGTLYPALMRLEQRGLVRGNWGTTETNRKARFYAVTPAGRRQLAREKHAWDRMAGIIDALLHGET